MAYRTRTYYTDRQKALMWERWREGWTLHQIAQLFNRPHTSVQGILSRTGGIRPPERSRSPMGPRGPSVRKRARYIDLLRHRADHLERRIAENPDRQADRDRAE